MDDKKTELSDGKPQIKVVGAITSELYREGNRKLVSYRFGDSWNIESDEARSFIEQVEAKFRRKNKSHSYLEEDNSPYSVPNYLKTYITKKDSFEDLADKLTARVVSEANEKSRVTSEVRIVFIHYFPLGTEVEEEAQGKVLVVMVDKKGVFDFDEATLQPKTIDSIDTDALRQAASYDITLFDTDYPMNSGAAYLQFIEGKSTSSFFKEALGCQDKIDNKRSAEQLFEAIEDFMRKSSILPPVREKVRDALQLFLEKKRKSVEKAVKLEDIQHVVDKQLDDGDPAKGTLVDFVNDHEYEVNHTFEPSLQSAKKGAFMTIFDDENADYELKINKNSVGRQGTGKPIMVDVSNKFLMVPIDSITLKHLGL